MDGVELICRTFLILKDYPEAKVVLLEENYRSTKKILQAANDVIKNNRNRRPKKLWTQNDEGEQIVYYRANDERDEAVFVASTIDNIVREKSRISKTSLFFTVPMLSLVPLRKPCSSLIFHIQWLVGQNSTAVKRFVMLFLI